MNLTFFRVFRRNPEEQEQHDGTPSSSPSPPLMMMMGEEQGRGTETEGEAVAAAANAGGATISTTASTKIPEGTMRETWSEVQTDQFSKPVDAFWFSESEGPVDR